MCQLATTTYQIAIHELFIEVLMKRDMHFCLSNISSFEIYLTEKMTYFEKWKLSCKGKKASNFLAPVTWQNLKMSVYGFIGYAKQVLTNRLANYVPMLHSNTSALEATFSAIQSLGGQNAASYKSRIGCRSATDACRVVNKSKSYNSEDILENEDLKIKNYDKCVIRGLNQEIDNKRKNLKTLTTSKNDNPIKINIVNNKDKDIIMKSEYQSELVKDTVEKITNKSICCHFSAYLFANTFVLEQTILASTTGKDIF